MTRLEAEIDPKSTAVDLVTFDLTSLDSGMWLESTSNDFTSKISMHLLRASPPVWYKRSQNSKIWQYEYATPWVTHERLCVGWRQHLAIVLVRKTKSITTLRRKIDELKSMYQYLVKVFNRKSNLLTLALVLTSSFLLKTFLLSFSSKNLVVNCSTRPHFPYVKFTRFWPNWKSNP